MAERRKDGSLTKKNVPCSINNLVSKRAHAWKRSDSYVIYCSANIRPYLGETASIYIGLGLAIEAIYFTKEVLKPLCILPKWKVQAYVLPKWKEV